MTFISSVIHFAFNEIQLAINSLKGEITMSAQQQLRKMLEKNYGFEFVLAKPTGFGERWQMRCVDGGIEAQLGVHRTCFYAVKSEEAITELAGKTSLPTTSRPLCFDTDEKTNICNFLEKTFNVSKRNTRQKVLFAEA